MVEVVNLLLLLGLGGGWVVERPEWRKGVFFNIVTGTKCLAGMNDIFY